MFRRLCCALVLSLIAACPAMAQVITFEVDPLGATPADDAILGMASAYTVGSLAITFGVDGNLDGIADTPACSHSITVRITFNALP